jgi:hypothetical protein
MSIAHLVSNSPLSDTPPLFAEALHIYKDKTGTDLLTHPLFSKLQGCDTVEKVIAVFDVTFSALDDFRKKMAFKWIKPMVHVLMSVTSLGDGTTVVSVYLLVCFLAFIHPFFVAREGGL